MFAKRYLSGISKTLLRGTSFAQLETNNIYLVNYQQTVTAWELPTVQWEGVTEQCRAEHAMRVQPPHPLISQTSTPSAAVGDTHKE